jgi:hypothetical protein
LVVRKTGRICARLVESKGEIVVEFNSPVATNVGKRRMRGEGEKDGR